MIGDSEVANIVGIISGGLYGGFPKLGGTILGVPILRTIVFWGLYWGSLILGKYHIKVGEFNRRCMTATVPVRYNQGYSVACRVLVRVHPTPFPVFGAKVAES